MGYENYQKYSSKDIRIALGVSLIKNILDQLNTVKNQLEELGMSYLKKTSISRDVQQLRSIMETTGDPIANDLLIEKINKLEEKISDQFPYPPLVRKCLREVYHAFRLAVGKHFQKYEGLTQKTMIESLKGVSILDEPKTGILPNKYKRNKVEKD